MLLLEYYYKFIINIINIIKFIYQKAVLSQINLTTTSFVMLLIDYIILILIRIVLIE